jgi:hypothetical protein
MFECPLQISEMDRELISKDAELRSISNQVQQLAAQNRKEVDQREEYKVGRTGKRIPHGVGLINLFRP